MTDAPLIFLSYTTADRPRVAPWYEFLKRQGHNAWIDKEHLIGGQQWDYEIRKALNAAALIVIFVSNNSVNRRGYVQREIRLALTKLEEKLASDIYIVPVLLDADAARPDLLSGLQFLDATDDAFGEQLIRSIQHQLTATEHQSDLILDESGIGWSKSVIAEEHIGTPGYAFTAQIPHLTSTDYRNLGDCTDIIKGWVKSRLCDYRSGLLSQDSWFSFGQSRSQRTNIWDASCADPMVHGQTVSIRYSLYWYGAGAAHGNVGFQTFAFFLEPFFQIETLQSIFENETDALAAMQACILEELSAIKWPKNEDDEEEQPLLDPDAIREGTKDWDALANFVFTGAGIEIAFGSYQVGPYVVGAHVATVPYRRIAAFLKPVYRQALRADFVDFEVPHFGEDALTSASGHEAANDQAITPAA
ncbi:TIR domain-containing protein [Sphingobium yanoikuyae]|uniref:TIR domain-containing protein n=1 Tax=Sphingobium yanoikuyae TaxID=13690 RepID=UPI001376CF9C|nr:TIR domain-containing protein [Sphingobium yanoikuyae]NBB40349.1 TIR domain-containing protein [Sphingobium yanoikuyae]